MKLLKTLLAKLAIFLFIGALMVVSLGPFLWVLMSSFKLNVEILNNLPWFPSGLQIKNYVTAFAISPIARYYGNSVVVATSATVLNLSAISMAAYVIARCRFKLRGFFRTMFSLALLIPGAALLLPIYTSIKAVGLYDNMLGLIIVYAGFGIPTTLFVLISYFLTIPRDLEESAYLDGAGFVYTFVRIILPLARPALATAGVLKFLNSWNEFQFALTLTTGHGSRTLPLALYYFKSAFASDYGAMFAATVLVALPSILVYILLQEQVVSGLAAGAVKG